MNAYRLVNADGAGRFVRFTLSPEKGETACRSRRATADPHYLMRGSSTTCDPLPGGGPARRTTTTRPPTPARPWPADRERVDLGVVEITGPDTERERDGDILVNDPMRVTDGIEPSDDPILHIRTYVYGESVRGRTGVERPDTL